MYQGQAPAYSELSSLYSAKRLYALIWTPRFLSTEYLLNKD